MRITCLGLMLVMLLWLGWAEAITIDHSKEPVILVFIYDYQCPHCHAMYPIVKALATEDHQLQVEYLPVAVLNQTSLVEASAAAAASDIGQFFNLTDTIMSEPALTSPQVYQLLTQMGLNTPAFINTMHSQAVEAKLLQGLNLMQQQGNNGVPVFIIYKSQDGPQHALSLQGEQSLSTLTTVINQMQGAIP